MSSAIRTFIAVASVALVAACAPAASAAAPATSVSKTLNKTQTIAAGTAVRVENMVGHVTVREGGSNVQVKATVVAGGEDHAAAKALADSIRLQLHRDNGKLVIHVHYPVDKHDTYRYVTSDAEQGDDSDADFSIFGIHFHVSGGSHSSFDYQGERVHVVRNDDDGVPLHVNLLVTLPRGSNATIYNHVGLTEAASVHADLSLKSDSGDIHAHAIAGKLDVDTGSGDVAVADNTGPVDVDTGSGDVTLRRIQGDVDLDVGSGDVDAHTLKGSKLVLETGSGDIRAQKLDGNSVSLETGSGDIHLAGTNGAMQLETGSGDIHVKGIAAMPRLKADTGSGDIVMSGNLSQLREFELETGSGDVTLTTSQPPSVQLDIDGSDIQVDWPHVSNIRSSPRHFSGDVGNASGRGTISTGSGDVVLTQ